MSTIEEKYEKFLITEDMKKNFDNISSLHSHHTEQYKRVIVQTSDTNEGKYGAKYKESSDGKLV